MFLEPGGSPFRHGEGVGGDVLGREGHQLGIVRGECPQIAGLADKIYLLLVFVQLSAHYFGISVYRGAFSLIVFKGEMHAQVSPSGIVVQRSPVCAQGIGSIRIGFHGDLVLVYDDRAVHKTRFR